MLLSLFKYTGFAAKLRGDNGKSTITIFSTDEQQLFKY